MACQEPSARAAGDDADLVLPTTRATVATPDADVNRAQVELANSRATLATRIVMPVLRTPERRTPEAQLVAARAAAAWQGWDLVNAILAFEAWLSTRFDGEGLELLARASLERDQATKAREYAEASLRVHAEPAARGVRMVLLARALDRLDAVDSAAAMYRRAADALPMIREWLFLRAAGSTRDAKVRQRLYSGVRDTVSRLRVPYTEAQALERFRMDVAAAAAYESLGDIPSAYRLRLSSGYNAAQRAGLRVGLLGYIQRQARGDDLQRALEVLDAAFPRLDSISQLLVSRRAAEAGAPARAAVGFSRLRMAMLTDEDVITWARSLMAAGRPAEAASRIAARRFGAAAMPQAQYVRALALVRAGRYTAARPVLQRVITYRTTPHAADALFLLGDLENDAGRETGARDLFARSCLAQSAGEFSDNACFRSGILSFALGSLPRAAAAFDTLAKRFPSSSEVGAALYWSGRSWERAGNRAVAEEKWAAVIEREPTSYYASASAKRLGRPPWSPPRTELPRTSRFTATLTRAEILSQLGMDVESRYEHDAVEEQGRATTESAVLAGAALLEHGDVARAIRLGFRAIGSRADSAASRDERAYAIAYPLLREVQLIGRAQANNLDPALVAGVIRQESAWNPRAVSRAGARGLMQIMPPVGQAIARSLGYTFWDPAMLFDADVSLELGTAHLRAATSSYNHLPRALAAYNAGASRVRRWSRRTGVQDPEVFTERIPYVETRDYVRIVLRNVEIYRGLYGLSR